MVDRKGTISGSELGAAQIGELFGMELYRKAKLLCRGEDLLCLGDRESDAFTKGIDRIGKLCLGDSRQRPVADEIDIGGMIVAIFGWKSVSAKIARHDIDEMNLTELARHFEHLQFGVDIETVARFDLDRGDTFGEQALESSRCRSDELIFRGLACRAYGRENAAARLGDLGIGSTIEAHFELVGAVAAVDEMGVAVDQARGQEPSAAIEGLAAFIPGCILTQTGPGDPAIVHDDSAVRDQPIGLAFDQGRELQVGEKHKSHLYKVVYTV